jgi:hypothetical protein
MFRRISYGFVSGAVIGIAIVVVLVATGTRVHDTDDSHADAQPSPEAAEGFVNAWKAMRTGTWSADETFVRMANDGRTFQGQIHEAQRPPKRVRVAFGTKTLELPGKTVVCAADSGEAKGDCRSEETSQTFEQSVDAELRGVQQLVVGSSAPYSVSQTTRHCFRLQARGNSTGSTWGQLATFCFDGDTGAMQSSEIDRGNVTDTTSATSIHANVSDAEFAQSAT